jgi:low temperature requirement protein LtrA
MITSRSLDRTTLDDGHPVTTLELFFDLVFVFTLTQLTNELSHHLNVETVFQVVLVFVVLFWMYGGYVWLTNQFAPVTPERRLLLIAGMGAFMVCALTIPVAFVQGEGFLFGLGYLLVVVVHGGLYALGFRRVTLRFVPFNLLAALGLMLAGLVGPPVGYLFWLAAIPLQLAAAGMSARASGAGLDIHSSHFVERHGLLLLVALGESVVAVGIGTADLELDAGVIITALLGVALAAALWWAYFVGDEDAAEHALRSAPARKRVRLAVDAFFYAFVPLLLGVVLMAAGVKLSLAAPFQPLAFEMALAVAGGVSLFLAADAMFRIVLRIGRPDLRLLTAIAALATVVVGMFVFATAQLAALVVVLVAMLAFEGRERTLAG